MTRSPYDIWEQEPDSPLTRFGSLRWRAQLIGYVGHFPSHEAAEAYVAAVRKEREKRGLK